MKLYRNIILVLVVVALLFTALVFVNKLNPNESDNPEDSGSESTAIMLLELNDSDVIKIDVKTSDEQYSVFDKDGTWTLNDDKNLRIKENSLQSFVYSCASLSVDRLISENAPDAAKYGFDEPKATIVIHLKNGSSKTIYVGDETIDKSSSYLKLADDNKIYLKSAYGINKIAPDKSSFIKLEMIDIDTSDLSPLSHVYITKEAKTNVKLKCVNENIWKMIEPVYSDVNGQVLADNVLTPVSTLSAVDVVEVHAKDLKPYGLKSPYAEFSIGYNGKTQKVVFGNKFENYRFAILDGFDTVYIVKESALSFLDVPYVDLMSKLIHVEKIDDVKRVEIKDPNTDLVLETNGEERFINGKKTDKSSFSKAYQAIIGISLSSIDLTSAPNANSDATIKYTKNDGSVVNVSFVSIDDRNYRALVDGKGNGIVNKNAVKEAIDFVKQTLNAIK